MTNDARTPDEIERDSAEERTRLSNTINDFQKKFSVESIVNDVGDMFRDQSSDLSRMVTRTVGRNPAAVALIGAGLAWLLIGRGQQDDDAETARRHNRPKRRIVRDQLDKDDRYESNRYSKRSDVDGGRFWYNDDLAAPQTPIDRWNDEGGALPGGASTGVESSYSHDTLKHRMSDTVDPLRDKAAKLADKISDAAAPIRDKAMALTDRLLHGTDGFSDEAKVRILAARRAAHDARSATQDAMHRGRKAASNMFDDQPLVVGALALAVGAAIGGALPRTRMEDDQMGASSDQLFATAQSVFGEERTKAMAVLKAAGSEAKGAVQDVRSDLAGMLPDGKTAADVVVDRLSSAAGRVLDGAKDEAARQGLGTTES